MTLNLQKYQIYMSINIILYKITCHISILAIQCIQGVFGTVVFQGYSIAMLLSRPYEDSFSMWIVVLLYTCLQKHHGRSNL